jgi:hypothetical protein
MNIFFTSLIIKINLRCILGKTFKASTYVKQCNVIIYIYIMKEINLEILPNGNIYTFFYVSLNTIPTCKVISK